MSQFINKPTQFGPGDTAYTNTVLDNIMGEQNVNGGRNILQELLFNPVGDHPLYSPAMKGVEAFKKPWLNDMIAPHINPGLIELLGKMFASPQDTTIGQGDFDLSKDTELQQMYLNQRK